MQTCRPGYGYGKMNVFDTHAHLLTDAFDEDREQVIARIHAAGVCLCMEAGTTLEDSEKAIEQARTHDFLYAAAGIHPHEAQDAPADAIDRLQTLLLSDEKCKALGEIGLDYHYDFSPREIQKRLFAEQLDLAIQLDKPVIIHDREAHADTLSMLTERKGKSRGILHCYSGSLEDAKKYLDMGFYLSFAGPLTFKNAHKLQEVAAYVPMDRVLCETDSPYLTPVPKRGQRNDPSNVVLVVEQLARCKQMDPEQVACRTVENGKAVFSI